MRRSLRLGLAAAIAIAALSGVAQAGTRTAAGSSNTTSRVSSEAQPLLEVDFQLYKQCSCPEKGRRHADVFVSGRHLVSVWDQPTKGDGFWTKERLVTSLLCGASDRICWLWTHEHRIRVGP